MSSCFKSKRKGYILTFLLFALAGSGKTFYPNKEKQSVPLFWVQTDL